MDINNVYNYHGQKKVPGTDYDGRFAWFTTCYSCGAKVKTTLSMKNKIYCDRCKNELIRQRRGSKEIANAYKYEIRFDKGVELLERKVKHFGKFSKAIEKARTKIRRFGSTDEVLAAIVLFYYGYDIEIQQKLGKYRADFLLMDKKLILEIDGQPFHSDKRKEKERDFEMEKTMGEGWRVLHIPTDLLRRKPLALKNAIEHYTTSG